MDVVEKKVESRYRNFGTVVYPDSAPENWMDIVSDIHVPCFISPLHDQDVNPVGNEPKKPHYHVMFMYEGKKSRNQILEVFSSFGGVGCEVINSIRGYARYLCHLDNPEKHQYNPENVKSFAGADYLNICSLATDKYKAIGDMMDFCNLECIFSFSYLCRYAKEYRYDWYRILCDSGAFIMKEYLKGLKWEIDNCEVPKNEQIKSVEKSGSAH